MMVLEHQQVSVATYLRFHNLIYSCVSLDLQLVHLALVLSALVPQFSLLVLVAQRLLPHNLGKEKLPRLMID